jgi:hypothetical protein
MESKQRLVNDCIRDLIVDVRCAYRDDLPDTPTSRERGAKPPSNLDLVKVIYIDEAGSSFEEPVFTWAAVVIRDSQWLKLEREAQAIIDHFVPEELQSDFEFHACDLFGGSENWFPWRNRTGKELRFEILTEFISLIKRYRLPIIECSWKRDGERDAGINKLRQGVAFSVCVDSVERWFVQNARADVGMLIADVQGQRRDEAIFKEEILRARRVSSLYRRRAALRHIVDTIHFAGSHESIGLQLADACAFFIKRHHAAKPNDEANQFYELLRSRIFRSRLI